MRTTFFTLLILLISQVSQAQINKGTIFLDASGGFNVNRSASDQAYNNYSGEQRTSSANLNSQIVFFISETFSIGAGISYSFSKSAWDNNGLKSEAITNFIGLTTSATKYINLADKLYFTGALTLSGGTEITKNEPENYTIYQVRANVSPGLAYVVSNRWMITTSIGSIFANYRWSEPEESVDNDYHEFNGGLNFNLNSFSVGFRYLLRNGE